nr:hypothetical protein B0A51_04274 [Rachicladosporium sp. CCFEE 5018]
MDRNGARNDRGGRRDDQRTHKPRYERDRSRSPRKERPDERRRDRSPIANSRGQNSRGGRGGYTGGRGGPRGGANHINDREGNNTRPPHNRQPEPPRPNSRQVPPQPRQNGNAPKPPSGKEVKPTPDLVMDDPPSDEDEEAAMQRLMGFQGFKSTKNTKVPGNDRNYDVSKVKKAEYRQYMNRVGGFNRPLSPGKG